MHLQLSKQFLTESIVQSSISNLVRNLYKADNKLANNQWNFILCGKGSGLLPHILLKSSQDVQLNVPNGNFASEEEIHI